MPSLRLDKWLWHARFARTRSMAGDLVGNGRVRVNGDLTVKVHRQVRPGDVVTLVSAQGIRVVRVTALGNRRGSPEQAVQLYETIAAEP